MVRTLPPAPVARLWQATNATARDFRLESIGEAWTSSVLSSTPDGRYEVQVPPPSAGWTAYFVEITYPDVPPQTPRTRRWRVTLYGHRVMGASLYLRDHHFPEAYSRIAA